jgi:hypothetical protein
VSFLLQLALQLAVKAAAQGTDAASMRTGTSMAGRNGDRIARLEGPGDECHEISLSG